jgi:hypothetical protein
MADGSLKVGVTGPGIKWRGTASSTASLQEHAHRAQHTIMPTMRSSLSLEKCCQCSLQPAATPCQPAPPSGRSPSACGIHLVTAGRPATTHQAHHAVLGNSSAAASCCPLERSLNFVLVPMCKITTPICSIVKGELSLCHTLFCCSPRANNCCRLLLIDYTGCHMTCRRNAPAQSEPSWPPLTAVQ